MLKKVLLVSSLCWIAGCAKSDKKFQQKKQKSKKHELIKSSLVDSVKEYTLIPDAPFGFVPIRIEKETVQNSEGDYKVQVQYCKQRKEASIDQAMIRAQLQEDMQLFGWQLCSFFETDNEWILWYKRPQNIWCSIVFKDDVLAMTVL